MRDKPEQFDNLVAWRNDPAGDGKRYVAVYVQDTDWTSLLSRVGQSKGPDTRTALDVLIEKDIPLIIGDRIFERSQLQELK